MIKLILIIISVWLIYTLFIKHKRKGRPNQAKPLKNMVRCETCGIHLPEDESVREDDRFFCSEAHRKQLSP